MSALNSNGLRWLIGEREHTLGARLRGIRSLRVALVVAALCAMGLLWVVDHSFQRLVQTNVERQTFQEARVTVNALMNNLVIAESSARGFALSGSAPDRTRFENAAARISDLLKQLDQEAGQTHLPANSTRDFTVQLKRELDGLEQRVKLRGAGQADAASQAATSAADDARMRQFDDTGTKLISQIDAQTAIRSAEFTHLANYSRLAFLACVLALLCGFVLYIRQRFRLRAADVREHQLLQTERDRLEDQVRARTQELTALATYLQRAVEQERSRLARELHDELGALMTAAKLDVARLKSRVPPGSGSADLAMRLQHLNTVLSEAIALKRRIMEDLYPSALHNLGLVAALEILVREFRGRSRLEVDATFAPVDLDAECQLTVYRMVQEATTNIAKYAHATTVRIEVDQDVKAVHVLVADDGDGFDPAQLAHGARGLAGMRHRLRACGGTLDIQSAPGNGTRLAARIPRQPAPPHG